MYRWMLFLWTAIGLAFSNPSFCQDDLSKAIDWHYGPAQAKVGKVAQLTVPRGYAYLDDGKDIRKLAEKLHNLYDPSEIFLLAPAGFLNGKSSWHMGFWYDATGYVPEKGQPPIDAAGILASARNDQSEENKELAQNGYETGEINGWAIEPHYDSTSKNLEWAYDLTWHDSNSKSYEENVNYCEKVLGQYGVLTVSLVAEKGEFERFFAEFKTILKTLRFNAQNLRGGTRAQPYGISKVTFNELVEPAFKKPTPEAAVPPNASGGNGTPGWAGKWPWALLLLLLLGLGVLVLRKPSRKPK